MDMVTAQQRTMKDFLELYNKLVHHCFDKCVSNFNHAKTSDDEMKCINSCADKCILFNQRHMMVFVEHQNAKQKLAAKAVESQAAAAGSQGEAALPAGAANAGQGAPPLAQGATTLVQGEGTVTEEASPKNVCGLVKRPVVPHFALLQSNRTRSRMYQGQSVVHQFLESGTANLEFV